MQIRTFVLFLALAFLALPLSTLHAAPEDEAPPAAPAQDDDTEAKDTDATPETAEDQAARDTWAWLEAVNTYSSAQGRAAMEMRKLAGNDPAKRAAVQKLMRENYQRVRPLRTKATDAFRDAFAKSNRAQFQGEHDAKMLERGLTLLAQQAMDDDPEGAIALWNELMTSVPTSRMASSIQSYYLPTALLSLADGEKAIAAFADLIATADEKIKPTLVLKLGDLYARDGDYTKAAEQYEAAGALIPSEELERRDPRARVKRDLAMRTNLVGKPCPPLGEGVWTNMDATTIEALKGKVVLLDFWATWCGPCRKVMPALEQMHKDWADKGLVVIGVTKDSPKRGYLPEKGDLPAESYSGTTPEEFMAHLAAFRQRTDITYPFAVIGKKVSSETFGVRGIPTLMLIDRDGTIGYISVGSGGKAALKAAIKRRLDATSTPTKE